MHPISESAHYFRGAQYEKEQGERLMDFEFGRTCVDAFGSDAVKEKYLPRLAKGELIGCFVSVLLSQFAHTPQHGGHTAPARAIPVLLPRLRSRKRETKQNQVLNLS